MVTLDVEKTYVHKFTGERKQMKGRLSTTFKALPEVLKAMQDRTLQTTDARIVWVGRPPVRNWEYEDFSFQFCEE